MSRIYCKIVEIKLYKRMVSATTVSMTYTMTKLKFLKVQFRDELLKFTPDEVTL